MKKQIIAAAVVFALGMHHAPVVAQSNPFIDALLNTYKTNPKLKEQREALKRVDENVNQALSGWKPNVQATYERGRQRNAFGATDWTYSDVDNKRLSVEQPLFNGGETVARTRSAKNAVKAGRAQLRNTEQEILLDAVEAYMNVYQNQAILELSHNNAEVLRQQLKASKDRFDVGEVTRTDVAQSEARLSRAESETEQSEGELAAARANFKRVVGYDAPAQLILPIVTGGLPTTLDEAQQIAQTLNPELESIKYQQLAADSDVSVQIANIFPDLSLVGRMSRDNDAGVFGTSAFDSDAVLLSARIPIYQSGAEYSRVRAAKNENQRLKFNMIDVSNGVRENVTRTWEGYKSSQATIKSSEDTIKAAEIALDGVRQEHQYGSRTTLDVLDAEQELFVAKVNLVKAQRNMVVAVHNLLAAMGRFSARDLGLAAEIYDPEEHYDDIKFKFIGF